MDINFRAGSAIGILTVESLHTVVEEDVLRLSGNIWCVPEEQIQEFITAANEMSRFNGESDVKFVKKIIDAFLSDYEKEELISILNEEGAKNEN